MFSSIGWPEIFAIVIIGIIIVGPERMPRVVEDVRAAVFAARKAIRNAKAELNGEFEELEELKRPISQLASVRRMGPRGVISKALFDDDEEFLDSFNPRKLMEDESSAQPARTDMPAHASDSASPKNPAASFSYADIYKKHTNNDDVL
ncbi:twin-arginine translocase subunit TatB [Corynebacterium sp. sy017]|uniref:twin-arginine translocase subunit TatB n=1 Tax=unclassified Corynebacterium TaxID=2624378 RepID=UPI0011859550|nr:twin-arginine translocase subunit TatB [Corynebacterium sp. SY003]MBP3088967.1 twin-arginine translocase subunit TatB [Corynebacterium sp. sy017]TSD91291.1 twin-arginine translocase subunit TatB [Corynebacterium sp. SY003]